MKTSNAGGRSSLLIIFLIVFIDLVGFGIVIPILPYYAQSYGASAWQLGWLMTTYSLMQFLIAPLWGRISDSIGRRPVLLISLLGSGISMTLLGLAGSLKWLFIARTFAGVCGANISTAYAYIADVTTEKDRAKGMGLVGAAFGLGFIFGPAIGGILSRYGYGFPMFVGAGLAFLNVIFAFFRLREPPMSAEARSANRSKRFDLASIRSALLSPMSRIAILIFFLLTLAVTQMEAMFAVYMKARYDYDAQAAGMLLALMGLVMVLMQGGLIGRLAKRFGERHLVIVGSVLCAGGLAGFAGAGTIPLLVAMLCVLAVGHGMLHPSLSSLTSLGASTSRRGSAMGVFQSAGSLARVVGPPVAGWLYDHVSDRSPFFGGSLILLVAFTIAVTLLSSEPAQRASSHH